MPIGGNQNPAALANSWKKGLVGGTGVGGDILLIDAIADTVLVKLIDYLGAIPIFVEVEGEVRQPLL